MSHLEELIREKKPTISLSSIRTYSSLLRTVYYLKHNTKDIKTLDWFNQQDEIIELLKDRSPFSRKTTLSALVAIASENDKYKELIADDSETYRKYIEKQEKSETQKENWKSFPEVKAIYDEMYARAKPLLNSKSPLGEKDRQTLQNFIVLALTCGVHIAPRRSTDWVKMKIKGDINEKEDNYMAKTEFIFNHYKTSRFYNEQRIAIPKGLKTILTKWIKKNPHDYLLTDNKGQPITNVRITQILNSIFDSRISTSMLRHIYLSDKYKDMPSLVDMKQMAHDMGHSVAEALEYVKH